MACGARLDALCRLTSIPDLAKSLYPGAAVPTAEDLQRRLVEDLAGELADLAGYLTGPQAGLLDWMLARFEAENIKTMIKSLGADAARPRPIPSPAALVPVRTLEEVIGLLPEGVFRESVKEAVRVYPVKSRPFFYEASLDRAYFRELLKRADLLSGPDRKAIAAMIRQEADIFHLALITRGKYVYGLKKEVLMALHIGGTEIALRRFAAMLGAADLASALDILPAKLKGTGGFLPAQDPAAVEAAAWQRFQRLADRAFRNSHIGFGVVAGYAALRRVETANLITICEGLRLGMTGADIRSRLIPRIEGGVARA